MRIGTGSWLCFPEDDPAFSLGRPNKGASYEALASWAVEEMRTMRSQFRAEMGRILSIEVNPNAKRPKDEVKLLCYMINYYMSFVYQQHEELQRLVVMIETGQVSQERAVLDLWGATGYLEDLQVYIRKDTPSLVLEYHGKKRNTKFKTIKDIPQKTKTLRKQFDNVLLSAEKDPKFYIKRIAKDGGSVRRGFRAGAVVLTRRGFALAWSLMQNGKAKGLLDEIFLNKVFVELMKP